MKAMCLIFLSFRISWEFQGGHALYFSLFQLFSFPVPTASFHGGWGLEKEEKDSFLILVHKVVLFFSA